MYFKTDVILAQSTTKLAPHDGAQPAAKLVPLDMQATKNVAGGVTYISYAVMRKDRR
jgi:hypothetical protein